MSDISSIGSGVPGSHGSVGSVNRLATPSVPPAGGSTKPTGGAGRLTTDSVELSDHARYLDQLRRLPAVRKDVIERMRQAIAEGGYDTQEKLDLALDRLLDSL